MENLFENNGNVALRPMGYERFKKMTAQDQKKYLEMIIDEYRPSCSMIGEMLGVSEGTVWNVNNKLGIHTAKGKRTSKVYRKWNKFLKSTPRDNAVCKSRELTTIRTPITWEQFKAMPKEAQKQYVNWLISEFNATATMVAEMFGKSQTHVHQYLKDALDCVFKFHVPTDSERKRWYEFCGISKFGDQYQQKCSKKQKTKEHEAEQQSEWISVEDRLPESEFVLCTDGKYCFVTSIPDMENAKEDGITHWMPLPSPPKPKEPTFKDVFLKKFPKAVYLDVDCCTIFPEQFDPNYCDHNCDKCWNLAYIEEEGEADA